MLEFPRTAPVTVVAELPAGAFEMVAEERDSATVDVRPYDGSAESREQAARTQVGLDGDVLSVIVPDRDRGLFRHRSGKVRVQVRVPLDSSGRIKVASADVRCQGRYAGLNVGTASGDVEIEYVTGDAHVETSSGDIEVSQVDGRLEVKGASGGLVARQVGGPFQARLASGDVQVTDAGNAVEIKTASGAVSVGTTRQGRVRIGTASGDVGVGVRTGTGVWLDLSTVSGTTRNALDMTNAPSGVDGPELTLEVRTVSGDIDVRRAA
ncbi:DUF4097 family beta strand repeat-containing protein [Plantactinospora endophytica]|uniref:DUF4097 domain-containing protein n=1 Tax=Plantactinospora endophytica TaxID=673535 RepID=A0ABQ4DW54_9ACTN|nr:DUF4097 family beta strand repeat-containing protein [Plantactinospora endophytica]GIG86685.1 hypothetical protein Pen02_16210 [Plantactinospora endophytica]